MSIMSIQAQEVELQPTIIDIQISPLKEGEEQLEDNISRITPEQEEKTLEIKGGGA